MSHDMKNKVKIKQLTSLAQSGVRFFNSSKELVEIIKNEVAKKHGFPNGILGSPWKYAMAITHRTKQQLQMYEEVIEKIINHYRKI